MEEKRKLNLQLFAEGGDGGGDGAATGVNGESAAAPIPGEQRLRELGVPENVIKNRANKRTARAKQEQAKPAQLQQTAEMQVPTAQEAPADTEETPAPAARRMTWDEILADEEYNQHLQRTVNRRLRSAKGAEEKLETITPALEVIARKYGQDPSNIDFKALADAVTADNTYFEDKAAELGVSLARARELDEAERKAVRDQRARQSTLEQQRMESHIQKVLEQANKMKEKFPNFDLQAEMQNPAFARMTHPNVGISVEDAYFAVHRNDLQAAAMQVATQKTAEQISNSIRANQRRPDENGAAGQTPSVTTFDYKNASKSQRAALKKAIRDAEARGEKIYPGQFNM